MNICVWMCYFPVSPRAVCWLARFVSWFVGPTSLSRFVCHDFLKKEEKLNFHATLGVNVFLFLCPYFCACSSLPVCLSFSLKPLFIFWYVTGRDEMKTF